MTTRRYPILVQLTIIFAATILFFLGILGYVLYSYSNTTTATVEYSDKVNAASTRLIMIKDAHTDYTRALLNMRGFLFYPDGAAQYEQGYRSNFNNSYETVKKYNAAAQNSDEDAGRLEKLLAEYLILGDKAIAAKKNNAPDLNNVLSAGRQLVDQIDAQFVVVAQKQGSTINAGGEFLINRSRTQSQIGMAASVIVTILVILIVVVYSRRVTIRLNNLKTEVAAVGSLDLTRADFHATRNDEIGDMAEAIIHMKRALRGVVGWLKTSADTLAASSEELTANSEQSVQAVNQIAASITGVATGADEQLAAANEASAVVEKMSAGIQQVSVSTNQVAEQSAQAAGKAYEGGKAVEEAVSQMIRVEDTVNTSAAVVAKLGERSKEIGQIVDTISGIAGQTNLLALNAAIEAARAGEQGRGFAVVAEEVRKLAEQSQEAAKKIAELIGEIQGDTDRAVVAMNDGTREVKAGAEVVNAAGMAFREIVEMVSHVSEQVGESSAAIQRMAGESRQIVGAVGTIDSRSKMSAGEAQTVSAAAEEQLASMEEIASSSEALSKLAQELQAEVAKFRV
ncbi:MAG TPA: HAMP domain-containing methyl-accepting chemotaxis protein [Selenomonadales bacterium]|nr:HAMP domain-containing methyl-accepting chemotaxis protein [Selenomonadales bacterium]